MINASRRGFLAGFAGLLAAPAIVRVASLMPVKSIEELYFADRMVLPLPYVDPPMVTKYREEFIRAYDLRPGAINRVQEVTQQLVTRPDGRVGVEMRYANGKVDFIPMS